MTTTVARAPTIREARWRAMGSDAHVLVVGGPATLLGGARDRIESLESRWSRFRPESELCRLNRAAGRPVVCSDDTYLAISAAVDAWVATEGRFDPTVLDAVVAAGYERDFATSAPGPRTATPRPTPGGSGIVLDPVVRAVTLPKGVAVDLGGIGKGLAADLVATMLVRSGASGACVNLGGDLRVRPAPHRRGMDRRPRAPAGDPGRGRRRRGRDVGLDPATLVRRRGRAAPPDRPAHGRTGRGRPRAR